jgi:hypothetical protein
VARIKRADPLVLPAGHTASEREHIDADTVRLLRKIMVH